MPVPPASIVDSMPRPFCKLNLRSPPFLGSYVLSFESL
ncbi:unnamed protein product [Brassica rapa subsp. narinosa]